MATEKQKIQEINNMFSIAKEGIAPQRREWLSRYKYWRGKEEIPRPKRRDNVTIPMVFMITDGIMSFLTDSAPRIKFLPQEETDLQVADWLNQIVGDYYWDKLNMYRVSEEVLWWAMSISGSGLAKWGIDTLSNEFYVKACNSFACFPDPNALNLKTCEFFHHAEVRTLKDIIRIYGAERGREVHMQPELNILAYETDDIIAPWGRTSYKSENLSEVWKDAQFKKDMGKAMVLETWMKDDTKIPIPFNPDEVAQEHEMIRQGQMPSVTVEQNHPAHLENHQNMVDYFTNNPEISSEYLQLLADHIELHLQEPQESYRLKYPKGKIITTANGVLLEEQNAPFGLPYSKMDFIINPREFWSVTLQEYIQPLQNSLTRGYRTISDIADRCSSPGEFINIMSGVDFEKITGEAGESVPVKGDPRMAVAWEQLPNIPNYLFDKTQYAEHLIEKVSNWHEVMQGKQPQGSPSGVVIQSLQEAVGPRLRRWTRHFEWFLCDITRAILQLLPYEDPKKIFTVLGPAFEEQRVSYMELMEKVNLDEGMFDVRIIAGSTLPSSRQEKIDEAIAMKREGIYPVSAVLKSLNDPNKQEILQEIGEINQLQDMVQQQQSVMKEMNRRTEDDQRKIQELMYKIQEMKYAEEIRKQEQRAKQS